MFFSLMFSIFLLTYLTAQSKYPADEILSSPDVPIIHKIGLLPIAAWQRISYNSNIFNCQFYPSCSNYGAQAVKQFGIIRGGIIASERITRCNPRAYHYHLELQKPFHEKDGRMIDPVIQKEIQQQKVSPFRAALISTIVPGAGRMYSGRISDGIFGLYSFSIYGYAAYDSNKNGRKFAGPLFGLIASYVYLSEIYGAWRTAKYYQKITK